MSRSACRWVQRARSTESNWPSLEPQVDSDAAAARSDCRAARTRRGPAFHRFRMVVPRHPTTASARPMIVGRPSTRGSDRPCRCSPVVCPIAAGSRGPEAASRMRRKHPFHRAPFPGASAQRRCAAGRRRRIAIYDITAHTVYLPRAASGWRPIPALAASWTVPAMYT